LQKNEEERRRCELEGWWRGARGGTYESGDEVFEGLVVEVLAAFEHGLEARRQITDLPGRWQPLDAARRVVGRLDTCTFHAIPKSNN
jgi:hypothetical protein